MELLAKKLPEIKLELQRITYIATEFDKDKGWDSYKVSPTTLTRRYIC
ncbi:hypothetical protein [Klebsiella pneumoniae]|nr:hypothetical protein [Klebsiella pneumoniae]VDB02532.1 hypothetical protein BANRA_05464 [Klebsiella pneumoniae]